MKKANKKGTKFMKNKKSFYIPGGVLCLIAAVFIAFALTHPELSFPWPNWVSYTLYAMYAVYTVLVFCMPKLKKPSLAVCGILAVQMIALALFVIFIGIRKTSENSEWLLFSGLALTFIGNLANFLLLKRNTKSK